MILCALELRLGAGLEISGSVLDFFRRESTSLCKSFSYDFHILPLANHAHEVVLLSFTSFPNILCRSFPYHFHKFSYPSLQIHTPLVLNQNYANHVWVMEYLYFID